MEKSQCSECGAYFKDSKNTPVLVLPWKRSVGKGKNIIFSMDFKFCCFNHFRAHLEKLVELNKGKQYWKLFDFSKF